MRVSCHSHLHPEQSVGTRTRGMKSPTANPQIAKIHLTVKLAYTWKLSFKFRINVRRIRLKFALWRKHCAKRYALPCCYMSGQSQASTFRFPKRQQVTCKSHTRRCIMSQSAIFKNICSVPINYICYIYVTPLNYGVIILYKQTVTFSKSTFCPHSVFVCFVWIWEQTAIIPLYSINWLVFYNWDGECLLRGTDWIFIYNSVYVLCVDLRTNSDYFPIQL